MGPLALAIRKYRGGERSRTHFTAEELTVGRGLAIIQALDGATPDDSLFEDLSRGKILAMIESIDQSR